MEVSRRTIIAVAFVVVGILFGVSIGVETGRVRGYGIDGYGEGAYGD